MKRLISVLFFLILQSVHADTTSLKRGAQVFMNHCSGCHTIKYMRDDRLSHDLRLTKADGPMHFMRISMPKRDARRWFGRVPPDLSLTATVRGTVWLTAYLKGFYPDSHRPFGANNRLLPKAGMPNVFAPMDQAALDGDVQDVVSFLEYVSDPSRLARYRFGTVVILFFSCLAGLFFFYKK